MYTPIQIGINDDFYGKVEYREFKPAATHEDVVGLYWRLANTKPLNKEFVYQVLPDACIDIVFTVGQPESAYVMTPTTSIEPISLGRDFDYVGVRLKVGAWQKVQEVIGNQLAVDDLLDTNTLQIAVSMSNIDQVAINHKLDEYIMQLKASGVAKPSPAVAAIMRRANDIQSVDDMAQISGYSPRQLQRLLKRETGFSPHDLLKIIRFQRSFTEDAAALYSDQSHYIRDFKQRTGSKPSTFRRLYAKKMSETSN